jgi:hypothetical protein
MPRPIQIAVVGDALCGQQVAGFAREVGKRLAQAGVVLLNGGRGGVMEAASAGAVEAGGLVVGILPGISAAETPPNPYLSVVLFSGLQQARNQVLVLSAEAVIAIHGGWGTLSEIATALKYRIPVVLYESWNLTRPDGVRDPNLHHARTVEEACDLALQLARARREEQQRL